MDIDGDTDDISNDKSPCWKNNRMRMCENGHSYFNSLANKGRWHTRAASQTSFFTRHTFFIVWVLNFIYIVRRVKNHSFSLTRDTTIAMKIYWRVAYFEVSHRAIMKFKRIIKDLCIIHIFISLNLID